MPILSPLSSPIHLGDSVGVRGGVPVILFAGESICVGTGAISEASAPYNGTITGAKIWKSADSTWPTLVAGTNNEAQDASSIGCEMSICKKFLDLSGKPEVRMVKYGASGKTLAADFLPTAGTNYVAMIAKFDAAIANLVAAKIPFYIVGLVWLQGINDALLSAGITNSNAYEANLTSFVNNVRTKYDRYTRQGRLPVVLGQISHVARALSTEWYYQDNVRHAQIKVSQALPDVRIARCDDIPVRTSDNVHDTTAGTITKGNRCAEQLLKTVASYVENRPPAYEDITAWFDPTIPYAVDATNIGYIISRAKFPVWGPGQATGTKKPTLVTGQNGLSVMSFDAGDVLTTGAGNSMLDFFNGNEGTIVHVAKRDAVVDGQIINMTRSSSGNLSISQWSDGNTYFDFGSALAAGRTYVALPGGAGFSTDYHAMEYVRRTNGEQQIYCDNVSLIKDTGKSANIAAGTGTLSTFQGGSNTTPTQGYNGKHGELIIYKRALTEAERTQLYAYLDAKYALPGL